MRISKDDLGPYEPLSWVWADSLMVNVRLWFPDPPDDPPARRSRQRAPLRRKQRAPLRRKRGARTEFLDFETVHVTVVVTTTIRHIDLEE